MSAVLLKQLLWFPDMAIFDKASFYRDSEISMVLTTLQCTNRIQPVGDDCQLGPPVFTPAGQKAWGAAAVFERPKKRGADLVLCRSVSNLHSDIRDDSMICFLASLKHMLNRLDTSRFCQSSRYGGRKPLVLQVSLWSVFQA